MLALFTPYLRKALITDCACIVIITFNFESSSLNAARPIITYIFIDYLYIPSSITQLYIGCYHHTYESGSVLTHTGNISQALLLGCVYAMSILHTKVNQPTGTVTASSLHIQ
jgi:hypothetical protein